MKIKIILGSTREGRAIVPVGKWVEKAAAAIDGFEVEVVDLKDYELPMFNEAISPRYNPNRVIDPKVQPLLDTLADADGFVIITPEYNHSIPAVLKNMFDYATVELQKKPVGIVSYGTVGGARAAEHLKGILVESKAAIVPEATAMVMDPHKAFDADGNLDERFTSNPYGPQAALNTTLTELAWWAGALKAAREVAATV